MVPKLRPSDDVVRTLRLLHEVGISDAIIAGGYVRDLFHDVIYTDVDIFVRGTAELRNESQLPAFWTKTLNLKPRSSLLSDQIQRVGGSSGSGGAGNSRGLLHVWDVFKDEVPYQIIVLDDIDPIQFVEERFDFGLCQAFFDGKRMRFLNGFLQDSLNKTITMQPGLKRSHQRQAINDHLPRIKQKYPGFTVVLPIETML